jgi:YHS domain-containing protein
MMGRYCLVVALFAVLMVAWGLGGCQKAEQTQPPVVAPQPPGAGSAAAVTDHKITQAEIGQDVVCPVMKTKFKVSKDTLAADYKGKVYYFCCPACPGPFKAEPEKYIK